MVAVATKYLPAREGDYQRADESDLILEGYIAFLTARDNRSGTEGIKSEWHYRKNPYWRQ
ncbi:hypothetical protein ACLB1S_03315 [Escherichia coli]